jgi:hypothetical protein
MACAGVHARRLCDLASPSHPAYNPSYREWLPRLAASEPYSAGRGPHDASSRPVPAEAIALLRRVEGCSSRIAQADCGCGGLARCSLGKGQGGLVNHQDCFACLRGGAPRRGKP